MRTVFRGVFIISEYGLRDGHRGPLPAELVLEVLCGAGDQGGGGEGEGGLVQGARGSVRCGSQGGLWYLGTWWSIPWSWRGRGTGP